MTSENRSPAPGPKGVHGLLVLLSPESSEPGELGAYRSPSGTRRTVDDAAPGHEVPRDVCEGHGEGVRALRGGETDDAA